MDRLIDRYEQTVKDRIMIKIEPGPSSPFLTRIYVKLPASLVHTDTRLGNIGKEILNTKF